MTAKSWIVTTSGERANDDIVRELQQKGFAVDQVLTEMGIITGAGSDDVAEKLRRVPGVVDVEPDQSIDIGPPDAPDTW